MSRETGNAQSEQISNDCYHLLCYCVATLCDCLKNFAPYCRPSSSSTNEKKNQNQPCIRDFSRALNKLQVITSNDQRLEKCVRCLFFCFITGICVFFFFFFFWFTTFYRHGHNLVLLKYTIGLRSIPGRLSVSHGPKWRRKPEMT